MFFGGKSLYLHPILDSSSVSFNFRRLLLQIIVIIEYYNNFLRKYSSKLPKKMANFGEGGVPPRPFLGSKMAIFWPF